MKNPKEVSKCKRNDWENYKKSRKTWVSEYQKLDAKKCKNDQK